VSAYCVYQVRRWLRSCGAEEKRDKGVDGDLKSVAQRAQEEPVPHQRREDHVGDHHEDDAHSSVHMVCKREEETQKRE